MERNRRQLLTGIGLGSITLLTGCSSGGNSSESSADGSSSNQSESSSFTPSATNRLFGSAMFRPYLPNADTPPSPTELDRKSSTDISVEGDGFYSGKEGVLIAGEETIYRIAGPYLNKSSNDSNWETHITSDNVSPTKTPHYHNGMFYFVEDDAIRIVDAATGEITEAFRPDDSRITDRLRKSTFANGLLYTPVGTKSKDEFSVIMYDLEQRKVTNTTSAFGITDYDSEDTFVDCNSPIIDNNGRIFLPIFKNTGLVSDKRIIVGDLEKEERLSKIPYSNTAENMIFRGDYLLYVDDVVNEPNLFVHSLKTGEEVFSTFYLSGVSQAIADDKQLYIAHERSTEVVAYELENGEETWRKVLVDEPNQGMVVANGVLYLGTEGNTILAYDTKTGEQLLEHPVENASEGINELVVINKNLYAVENSNVFRFDLT